MIEYLMEAGNDVIMFGDDWGTQTGPFISPDQFQSIFKPRYRAYFDAVRRKGGRVLFHCCGRMGGILDDLTDLGIDCLWHQTNLYDPEKFAGECREKNLCVFLHPDRQRLMPHGTPGEIREAVARFADIYHGKKGGGIFYVEIENDIPFENAEALVRAVRELG
jgi:uroporphyrinogen-III decarboxylase